MNIVTHAVDDLLCEDEEDEDSSGFFMTILSAVWSFVFFFVKLGILLVILYLLFVIPASAVLAVTGPLVRIKSVSSGKIVWLNTLLVLPIEYILLISFTDYFHALWWIMFPLFLLFVFAAWNLIQEGTVGRRCPKCSAVDTIKSKSIELARRQHYEYKTYDHKGKLKYEGYSLKRMQEEWSRKVVSTTWRTLVTEIDYQRDSHCTECDYTNTSYYTEVKKASAERYSEEKSKELWKEKN